MASSQDKTEIYEKLNIPKGYIKPTGMMLLYPVISAKYHRESFYNLLMNKNASFDELDFCSIEKQVSKDTCPAFIMHTSNDEIVDIKNTLVLANALTENNIKFEMHIYPDAPHGIALGNEITKCGVDKWCNSSIAEWVKHAAKWAENV